MKNAAKVFSETDRIDKTKFYFIFHRDRCMSFTLITKISSWVSKKMSKIPSKLVTKNDFPKNHHLSISFFFSKSFTFIFWHIFNFAYAACVRSKALTQVEMTLQASASGLSDEDGQKLSTLRTRLVTGNVEKPMRTCQGPPFTPSYYRRSFGQNWIERVLDPGSVWN